MTKPIRFNYMANTLLTLKSHSSLIAVISSFQLPGSLPGSQRFSSQIKLLLEILNFTGKKKTLPTTFITVGVSQALPTSVEIIKLKSELQLSSLRNLIQASRRFRKRVCTFLGLSKFQESKGNKVCLSLLKRVLP